MQSLFEIASFYVSKHLGSFTQDQLNKLSIECIDKVLKVFRDSHQHRCLPLNSPHASQNFILYVNSFQRIIRNWEISPNENLSLGENQALQIQALSALDNLERLTLNRVSPDLLRKYFPVMHKVKTLVLKNCSLPQEFYSQLSFLFPNLENVEIFTSSVDSNLVSSLPRKVVSLSINSPNLSGPVCQQLVEQLKDFPNLKSLELTFGVNNAKKNKKEIIEALDTLPANIPQLKTVTFYYLYLDKTDLLWDNFTRVDKKPHINVISCE